MASLALDPYGMDVGEPETGEGDMPDAVDLPPAKPETRTGSGSRSKPAQAADEPATPDRKPAKADDRQEQQEELAYARPDRPLVDAFKQGRITHMVVVPSMSKMPKVQMVSSHGRGT